MSPLSLRHVLDLTIGIANVVNNSTAHWRSRDTFGLTNHFLLADHVVAINSDSSFGDLNWEPLDYQLTVGDMDTPEMMVFDITSPRTACRIQLGFMPGGAAEEVCLREVYVVSTRKGVGTLLHLHYDEYKGTTLLDVGSPAKAYWSDMNDIAQAIATLHNPAIPYDEAAARLVRLLSFIFSPAYIQGT